MRVGSQLRTHRYDNECCFSVIPWLRDMWYPDNYRHNDSEKKATTKHCPFAASLFTILSVAPPLCYMFLSCSYLDYDKPSIAKTDHPKIVYIIHIYRNVNTIQYVEFLYNVRIHNGCASFRILMYCILRCNYMLHVAPLSRTVAATKHLAFTRSKNTEFTSGTILLCKYKQIFTKLSTLEIVLWRKMCVLLGLNINNT